ncbi:MAG TPA: hypothetical protein VI732_06440 [Alphaproteobacteria bacterium]|nr:hypothetical protein [Alphaproteobacteria bacterium]
MSPKWHKPCVGLLAALLLVACAKSNSGALSAANAAPAVPVAPGTATLYVLNSAEPTFVISSNTIYDGQQQLVTVSEGRYAIVAIYPGRHVLSCAGMPAVAPAVLDAVPGQTYYLQTYLGSATKQICGLLPADVGRKALAQMKGRR